MAKKMIVVFLIVFFSAVLGAGNKVIPMPDLMKPEHPLYFDNTQMYVIEGTSIYIYLLKDFKLVKKFGKRGEGPKEFILNPRFTGLFINVRTQDIVVESLGKLSWFTKDGTFKKELKLPNPTVIKIQPFGNHFIGEHVKLGKNRRQRLCLYDHKMNQLKEIVYKSHPFQQGKGLRLLQFMPLSAVYKDKLFLAWEKDFVVKVVDTHIDELYTFTCNEKKEKVTQSFKKKAIDYLKTAPETRDYFHTLKPILFPEYYPAMGEIFITGDTIYVITFKEDDAGNDECILLDLKGNHLKRVFLPLKMNTPLIPHPYGIHQGSLYQVAENEEEEKWELHITEIK